MPIRIQRQRTAGWKQPENTIYVGRPTKWGNPFRVGMHVDYSWFSIFDSADTLHYITRPHKVMTPEGAVGLYEKYCAPRLQGIEYHLSGKNLSCFCPLGQPCHADVLLKLANKPLGSCFKN